MYLCFIDRCTAGSLEAVLIRNAGLGHNRLALTEFLEALSGYHNLELNFSSPCSQNIVAGAGKMLSLMAPLKLRSLSLGHNSLGSAPHHLDTLLRFASRATLLQTLDLSMYVALLYDTILCKNSCPQVCLSRTLISS